MFTDNKIKKTFTIILLLIIMILSPVNTFAASGNHTGAYSTIYNALNDSRETIDLESYSLNADEADTLFHKVLYENPELFYIEHSIKYRHNSKGITLSIKPTYKMTGEALSSAKQTYKDKLNEIVGSVNSGWSDLEKIVYINDYFATHFSYKQDIVDAYSLFTGRTGNCEAYTIALTAVMKELDIPVSYVSSKAMDHCWNLVYVNGDWYHLDINWDDPIPDMPGRACHINLLLSDKGIKAVKHNDWTGDYSCTSTKYDGYFWKDVYAPILYNNGLWYYIDNTDSNLYSYDFDAKKRTFILNIGSKWSDSTKNNVYWAGCFSGLGCYNGILYYNTPTEIQAYNPVSNSAYTVKTISSSDSIYNFAVSGNKLTYYLYSSPQEQSTGSGEIDLDSVNTKYKITYRVGGSDYATQTYTIGDTVTAPDMPQKTGYAFTGWDQLLPQTMPQSDLIVNAVFKKSSCSHQKTHETVTPATCAQSGRKEIYCDSCGAIISSVVIPAAGHTSGDWEVTKQASCGEPGTKIKKCTVCGAVLEKQFIPATRNHTYGDWETIKQPTYAFEGIKQQKCSVCGDIIQEEIPALSGTESRNSAKHSMLMYTVYIIIAIIVILIIATVIIYFSERNIAIGAKSIQKEDK